VLFLACICCFAMYWTVLQIIPLATEKRYEGRLFVEDEVKLKRLIRRLYVLVALTVVFLVIFCRNF